MLMYKKMKKLSINSPVSIVFLAEHVPEVMLEDASKKVTKWLKERKNPSQIEKILYNEDSKIKQTKGVREDESEYWEDTFDTYGLLVDFYRDSFKRKVDRIIYTDDNAFCHIIGVRGYPNAPKIVEYLGKNGDVVMTATSVVDWPKDLLTDGVNIKSLHFHSSGIDVTTMKKSYEIKFKETWIGKYSKK